MIATEASCRNGHGNSAGATFCSRCGERLAADGPPPPPPPASSTRPIPGRLPSRRGRFALVGAAAALAAVVGALALRGGSDPSAALVVCADQSYARCVMPASWQEAQTQGTVAMHSADGLEGVVEGSDYATPPAQAAEEYLSADDGGERVGDVQVSPSSSTEGTISATINGVQIAGDYVYEGGAVSVVFAPAASFTSWTPTLNRVLASIQVA
jgi:hypothetical protein